MIAAHNSRITPPGGGPREPPPQWGKIFVLLNPKTETAGKILAQESAGFWNSNFLCRCSPRGRVIPIQPTILPQISTHPTTASTSVYHILAYQSPSPSHMPTRSHQQEPYTPATKIPHIHTTRTLHTSHQDPSHTHTRARRATHLFTAHARTHPSIISALYSGIMAVDSLHTSGLIQ